MRVNKPRRDQALPIIIDLRVGIGRTDFGGGTMGDDLAMRDGDGALPPVVGGFESGVGLFEGEELFEGRPVRVRFEWSQMHTGAPRWQQAFSEDGGATWEVNWVMEMARPV